MLENRTETDGTQQSNLSDAEVEVGVKLVDHAIILDHLRHRNDESRKPHTIPEALFEDPTGSGGTGCGSDLTEKMRIEKARTPMRMGVRAHSTPPKALRRRPGDGAGGAALASVSAIAAESRLCVCGEGRGRRNLSSVPWRRRRPRDRETPLESSVSDLMHFCG